MSNTPYDAKENSTFLGVIQQDFKDVAKIYFMPIAAVASVFRHAVKAAQRSLNADLRAHNDHIPK